MTSFEIKTNLRTCTYLLFRTNCHWSQNCSLPIYWRYCTRYIRVQVSGEIYIWFRYIITILNWSILLIILVMTCWKLLLLFSTAVLINTPWILFVFTLNFFTVYYIQYAFYHEFVLSQIGYQNIHTLLFVLRLWLFLFNIVKFQGTRRRCTWRIWLGNVL